AAEGGIHPDAERPCDHSHRASCRPSAGRGTAGRFDGKYGSHADAGTPCCRVRQVQWPGVLWGVRPISLEWRALMGKKRVKYEIRGYKYAPESFRAFKGLPGQKMEQ